MLLVRKQRRNNLISYSLFRCRNSARWFCCFIAASPAGIVGLPFILSIILVIFSMQITICCLHVIVIFFLSIILLELSMHQFLACIVFFSFFLIFLYRLHPKKSNHFNIKIHFQIKNNYISLFSSPLLSFTKTLLSREVIFRWFFLWMCVISREYLTLLDLTLRRILAVLVRCCCRFRWKRLLLLLLPLILILPFTASNLLPWFLRTRRWSVFRECIRWCLRLAEMSSCISRRTCSCSSICKLIFLSSRYAIREFSLFLGIRNN